MRLLLTSAGLSNELISDSLLKLTEKHFSDLKVAFIANAADNYVDKWFVEKDRNSLLELGMNVSDVDLRGKTSNELLIEFENVDVIFVAGGNTFYLLQKMIESGADKIISNLVKKGVVYVGSSAGSVLVGPSIEPVATSDDPKEAPMLKSFEGLRLVDFVTLPHFNKNSPEDNYAEVIKKYSKKYKLVTISDKQAITVNDNNFEIVG
jgi:dipeptidase E